MFERFTKPAREAVVRAQVEARSLHHKEIGNEHLLLALLDDPTSVAGRALSAKGVTATTAREALLRIVGTDRLDAAALASLGIDLEEVRRRVEANFGEGALDRNGGKVSSRAHIPFTAGAKKSLELALREALALKHNYIGTEHILLGLTRDTGGLTAQLLAAQGVELASLRDQILRELKESA